MFSTVKAWLSEHGTLILLLIVGILGSFILVWWRLGFTLEFFQPFAFEGDIPEDTGIEPGIAGGGGGGSGCIPINRTCDAGNTVFQHYSNCNGETIQDCDNSGQVCESGVCVTPSGGGGPTSPSCGDNFCNGTETCSSCAQDCGSCPPTSCVPTNRTCNGTSVFQHYSNCNGQNIQDCAATGQVCQSGACTGTAPTPTPAPAPGGATTPVFTVTNETWTPGACDNASSFGGGQASANVNVSDSGSTETHLIWNTFHSNTAGCGATTEGGSGGSDTTGKCSFQPHESGTCSVWYNIGRHNCGRVQVDAALAGYNVFIGQVINYGVDCVEATPPPTIIALATTTATPPPLTATPPPPTLTCEPATQTVGADQSATMVATGGTGTYAWAAPLGSPASGTGAIFGTAYGVEGTYTVTVTSGSEAAICEVIVTTEPQALMCSPDTQTVAIGQVANIVGAGGSGTYDWSASPGTPLSGTGGSFGVSYNAAGTYQVTISDPGTQESAMCDVVVPATETPPIPTMGLPGLQIEKQVRNVTQGSGEADTVSANPHDTVEFVIRVSSLGTSDALAVRVRDTLPARLTYVSGTTMMNNGNPLSDGIVTGGVSIGDMGPGVTHTIRFQAQVASDGSFPNGTTILVNTAYASGSNVPEVSDVAFVTVTKTPENPILSIRKLGRNISRNQIGEHTSVAASPNESIEFTIRVQNVSGVSATNVMIQDVVPGGVAYQAGSVTLNGQPTADTLVTNGINIGTLSPGQEAIVRFLGRIAAANQLPEGMTTLINSARTWSDGTPILEAQLPIIITNEPIDIPPVDTGPGETTALALIVSAIVTLMYIGYTSTETFRRREVSDISRGSGDSNFTG